MQQSRKEPVGFSIHWRRIVRFVERYRWLVVDSTRGRRRLVLMVIVLSMAAAGTQGLIVGILGFFAELLSNPDALPESLAAFVPTEGLAVVFLIAGSLFAALLGNSIFAWGAVRLSRSVGRSYQERVARSVLESFATSPPRPLVDERRDLIMTVMRSGRILGKAVEALLGAVPAVFQTLVAAAIVLATEPILTLSVAPLLLLLAPFIYRLGGQIRERSREFYDTSFFAMSSRIREFVGVVDDSYLPAERPAEDVLIAFDRDPVVARFLDLSDEMQLSGPRTVFIASAFRSFMIVIVVGLAGYNVVQGAYSWGSLTVYIAALGYLLNNLQKLSQTVTKLNKSFPQLDRYMLLLDQAAEESVSSPPLPQRLELRLEASATRPGGSISLEPGTTFYYAPPVRMGRLAATAALAPLAIASGTPIEAWAALPFLIRTPEFERVDDGAPPDPGPALAALHSSDSSVALVGSDLVAELDGSDRERVLASLADRVLLLVLGQRGIPGHDWPVLLADEAGLRIATIDEYLQLRPAEKEEVLDDEVEDAG
jgi:ABC-type multidrug transport system fused ATPase/permease subunit